MAVVAEAGLCAVLDEADGPDAEQDYGEYAELEHEPERTPGAACAWRGLLRAPTRTGAGRLRTARLLAVGRG